eukprot:1579263-Pleurochrysis_carterae.AAC.1
MESAVVGTGGGGGERNGRPTAGDRTLGAHGSPVGKQVRVKTSLRRRLGDLALLDTARNSSDWRDTATLDRAGGDGEGGAQGASDGFGLFGWLRRVLFRGQSPTANADATATASQNPSTSMSSSA